MSLPENIRAELFRKFFHFGVVFGHFIIISFINFWLGFALLILGLIVVYIFRHSKLGKFAASTRKRSLGQYYLFIGLIIVNLIYLIFPYTLALFFAYFALGISDVVAGFVPYFMAEKTKINGKVEISTASLIYASVVFGILNLLCLLFFRLPVVKAIFITLLLGIIEFFSRKGSDNITVPILGYLIVLVVE